MARLAAALVALAVLGGPAAAGAATRTVDDPTEAALRQAIAGAAPGDTVQIAQDVKRIVVRSEVLIDQPITLRGNGAFATKISGGDATRVLRIDSPGPVTLTQLGIVHGRTTVDDRHSGGGGILGESGPLTLDHVFLNENRVDLGAPDDGEADQGGGGVMARDALTVRDSWLWFNTVDGGATGSSTKGGGGIYAAGPSLLVDHTDVEDNHLEYLRGSDALGGAGIYVRSPEARIVDTRLSGNFANPFLGEPSGSGGAGVYADGADLTVERSIVEYNRLDVSERIFDSKPAFLSGAGVLANRGHTRVLNSWFDANGFSSNDADENAGGAIGQGGSGRLELVNDTIAGNEGGVWTSSDEPVTIANTMFAYTPADCEAAPGAAGFESAGHNLEEGDDCGLDGPGDMMNVHDLLDCERPDYTYPDRTVPCRSSPAVDHADPALCPDTDVRGTDRPQGHGCDIGALEVEWYAVETGEPAQVGGTGATLGGEVFGNEEDVEAWVEWGGPGLEHRTAVAHLPSRSAQGYSERVTGLEPGHGYYYRLVVHGPLGVGLGEKHLFFTPLRAVCTMRLPSRHLMNGRAELRVTCDRRVTAEVTSFARAGDRRFHPVVVTRYLRAWRTAVLRVPLPAAAAAEVRNGGRVSATFDLVARGPGKPGRVHLGPKRLLR